MFIFPMLKILENTRYTHTLVNVCFVPKADIELVQKSDLGQETKTHQQLQGHHC